MPEKDNRNFSEEIRSDIKELCSGLNNAINIILH